MTVRLSNFFNLTAGKTNESSFDIFLLFTSLDYCRPVFCFVELESTSGRHCCILVSSHEMQMPISSQRQHQRPPNWQQDFLDSSPLAGDKEFSTIIFFHLMEIFFFVFDYPTAFVVLMSPRDNRISLQHVNRLLS